MFLEFMRKGQLIRIADFRGNIFDRQFRGAEQMGGMFHFPFAVELFRRHLEVGAEQLQQFGF